MLYENVSESFSLPVKPSKKSPEEFDALQLAETMAMLQTGGAIFAQVYHEPNEEGGFRNRIVGAFFPQHFADKFQAIIAEWRQWLGIGLPQDSQPEPKKTARRKAAAGKAKRPAKRTPARRKTTKRAR